MTTNVKFDFSACCASIHKLANRLALGKSASSWYAKAIDQSIFLKPLTAPGRFVRAKLQERTSSLGGFLQLLSFLLALGLIICFGLPQFANDKSGLAIISICGLGAWVTGWLLGGKQERPLDALDFIVLLYLGANLIAAFSSHYFNPSLKGMAKVVIYIGTYFWFTSVLAGSLKKKLSLFATLVLTGLALSVYGLYQYKIGVAPLATWEDPSLEVQATRIYATLGNPNLLAGFLLPIVPIACAFSAWFFSKKCIFKGLLSLSIVALVSLATVLTGSRGGYLGLFAGLFMVGSTIFIYVFKEKPKLRIALTGGVLVLILAAGLGLSRVPSFASRVESMFSGREHSSNSYRLNVYDSSWKMFKDNWWFGTGTGNETFVRAYGLYMVSGYDALGTYSVPLEVAVESGILGVASFLTLILCVMGRAHTVFWQAKEGAGKWLALGVAAAIAGLMIHGLVDTVFYRPQIQIMFWLLISAVSVRDIMSASEKNLEKATAQGIGNTVD